VSEPGPRSHAPILTTTPPTSVGTFGGRFT
jgi:hypothetical protein